MNRRAQLFAFMAGSLFSLSAAATSTKNTEINPALITNLAFCDIPIPSSYNLVLNDQHGVATFVSTNGMIRIQHQDGKDFFIGAGDDKLNVVMKSDGAILVKRKDLSAAGAPRDIGRIYFPGARVSIIGPYASKANLFFDHCLKSKNF